MPPCVRTLRATSLSLRLSLGPTHQHFWSRMHFSTLCQALRQSRGCVGARRLSEANGCVIGGGADAGAAAGSLPRAPACSNAPPGRLGGRGRSVEEPENVQMGVYVP